MITENEKLSINIILPDIQKNLFLNLFFTTLQNQRPHVFNENFVIAGVHGCLGYSIWSSFRTKEYIEANKIKKVLDIYKNNNISVNYIFNNSIITKEDLYDSYSNLLLQEAHDDINGVFVSSDILYDYIKHNYPKYRLIRINKKEEIIEQKYKYISLNPFCPYNCHLYDIHHKYIENEQLNFYNISGEFICPLKYTLSFYDLQTNDNFVTVEKIFEYNKKQGINYFVISSGNISKYTQIKYSFFDIIESYLYYLIKPQYQNSVKNLIIKKLTYG